MTSSGDHFTAQVQVKHVVRPPTTTASRTSGSTDRPERVVDDIATFSISATTLESLRAKLVNHIGLLED